MGKTRRDVLKLSGAALATGLAGCQSNNRDNDNRTNPDPETPPQNNTDTDTPENNETDTEEPEPEIPDSYRADRKRIAETGAEPKNVGDYQTEQSWDDLTTNTQELRETQERVLEEQAYTPLVNQIMSGEDFSSGNYIFPNWEGEDDGHFDQDTVKNEDDFETLIRWYLPAIMHHDRENYGNAPSGRNHRFATTLETLINEHHPEAEAVSTSAMSLPAHGIFGVQDQNNEEFYLVDTTPTSAQTDSAVAKIGEDFVTSENGNRSELWDPFHEPYEGDATITYNGKKGEKITGLANFVTKGTTFAMNGKPQGKIFITDEWLDDAYNALRNGGSIDPITEPIEEVVYNQRTDETDNNIGIYGNLDDTRIAVTTGDEIYDQVMHEPEPQSIDDIETMLEAA